MSRIDWTDWIGPGVILMLDGVLIWGLSVAAYHTGQPTSPPEPAPISCPAPPSPIVVFGDALRAADAVCGPVPFTIDVWPDGRVHFDCGRPLPLPKQKLSKPIVAEVASP
jgi:hypothetical protein